MSVTASHSLSTPLYTHFGNHVVRATKIIETSVRKASRISLQFLAIAVGVGGKIPYISTSLKYAGDNKPLGYTLATGSVVSWGIFSSYCLLTIVNNEMRPLSEQELKMRASKNPCHRSAELIALLAVAVFSQFPLAYLCYVNNDNQIAVPVVVMIDSASSFYSLILSANAFHERRKFSSLEQKQLLEARNKLIEAIERFRRSLPDYCLDSKEYLQLTEPFTQSYSLESLLENASSLFSAILDTPVKVEEISLPSKIVGTVFSVSQLAMYAMPTYFGMQALGANQAEAIAGAVGVVAVNAYLMGDFLTRSVHNQWKKVKAAYHSNIQPSLASTCFPKIRKALSLFDLGASSISYGVAAEVSEQYFPSYLSEPQKYVSAISTFFLITHLLEPTLDGIVLAMGKRTLQSKPIKAVIDLDQRLGFFIQSLKEAPPFEIEKLLDAMPADLSAKLLPPGRPLSISIQPT